ncbi:hypothetical protein C8R46DRAFT_1037649 [Mycena filopes]|nr:hypothetical protein C8R46DRAFT_1037649 [Mycena filopes]
MPGGAASGRMPVQVRTGNAGGGRGWYGCGWTRALLGVGLQALGSWGGSSPRRRGGAGRSRVLFSRCWASSAGARGGVSVCRGARRRGGAGCVCLCLRGKRVVRVPVDAGAAGRRGAGAWGAGSVCRGAQRRVEVWGRLRAGSTRGVGACGCRWASSGHAVTGAGADACAACDDAGGGRAPLESKAELAERTLEDASCARVDGDRSEGEEDEEGDENGQSVGQRRRLAVVWTEYAQSSKRLMRMFPAAGGLADCSRWGWARRYYGKLGRRRCRSAGGAAGGPGRPWVTFGAVAHGRNVSRPSAVAAATWTTRRILLLV